MLLPRLAQNFYRPQTKFAKVMFSQVFVCPQGGVSVQGGVFVQGGLSPGGSLSGRGLCPGGGLCQGDPPYGYIWAVCILLECILVHRSNCAGGGSLRRNPRQHLHFFIQGIADRCIGSGLPCILDVINIATDGKYIRVATFESVQNSLTFP